MGNIIIKINLVIVSFFSFSNSVYCVLKRTFIWIKMAFMAARVIITQNILATHSVPKKDSFKVVPSPVFDNC